MREETRPRPLATEQDSLCSNARGPLDLPSRTEFPESLRMGKQAATSTRAPCTLPGFVQHHSAGRQRWLRGSEGCTIRMTSRCPSEQKGKHMVCPTISISVLQRATSEARSRDSLPGSHTEQRRGPGCSRHPQHPHGDLGTLLTSPRPSHNGTSQA